MAKSTISQPYPRVAEDGKYAGMLNTNQLAQHIRKIPIKDLKRIIKDAIEYANRKSSRAILDIPNQASDEEAKQIYLKQGRSLFSYFKKYCGDPATTAYECCGRSYSLVAAEQFFNRAVQKGWVNFGWRCPYIASECVQASMKSKYVSKTGFKEIVRAFGKECRRYDLLDAKGNFNDAKKLVRLFCSA